MGCVYWLLIGDEKIASSRIHGINVHKELLKKGYNSQIILKRLSPSSSIPSFASFRFLLRKYIQPDDIFVIQKITGREIIDFIQIVKSKEAKVVYLDCDLPLKLNEAVLSDLVICPSNFLAKKYLDSGISNVIKIDDYPEEYLVSYTNPNIEKKKFNCIWFGYLDEERKKDVEFLKEVISDIRLKDKWNVTIVSNHKDSDHKWDLDTFPDILNESDVVVIPVVNRNEFALSKSSNRVLQSMAYGKPVIASDIPAYIEVINNYENGILCEHKEDWINALLYLESEKNRQKISESGHKFIADQFNSDKLIEEWFSAFNSISVVNKSIQRTNKYQNRLKELVFFIQGLREINLSQGLYYLGHSNSKSNNKLIMGLKWLVLILNNYLKRLKLKLIKL